MLSTYLKFFWRNIQKNKLHSTINILGLAVGLTVTIVISLWINNELSYEQYNSHYSHIARVMQNMTSDGVTYTFNNNPFPLAEALRTKYPNDFTNVVMGYGPRKKVINYKDKILLKPGGYFEQGAPELMDLPMVRGSRSALHDGNTVILSLSLAKTIFGEEDPLGKMLQLDGDHLVKVTGVYKDLPDNSAFSEFSFLASWNILYEDWQLKDRPSPWRMNAFQVYIQLPDHANLQKMSEKIKDVKLANVEGADRLSKPQLFLQPMNKWHLYSAFKDGQEDGGKIKYIWMYALIALMVLLLAGINFINLSTAKSEKRAKEVGVRKAVGAERRQLIFQFMAESLSTVLLSLLLALLFTTILLPFFNKIADKNLVILWTHPLFWLLLFSFSVSIGLLAGLYPALYLSSFRPVKVLKGTFKVGSMAIMPRRILIVTQFTLCIILMIGTIVVYRQIKTGMQRDIGYDRYGLVTIPLRNGAIHEHFEAFKHDLLGTGSVSAMAEAESGTTGYGSGSSNFQWAGKDPALATGFNTTATGIDYGKTVGWTIVEGRDFSKDYAGDSAAFIINEAAVKYMGLKNPVGQVIKWFDKPYTIVGVTKDIIIESPYEPVKPFFFYLSDYARGNVLVRLNRNIPTHKALADIETIYKKFSPAQPFEYTFTDEEYQRKFSDEQTIVTLSLMFTLLAIFISCFGLFGMVSFLTEQRKKEIGIRKIIGASVTHLWLIQTKEFVFLILLSLLIATPFAWMIMHNWLAGYEYKATMPLWLFALAGILCIAIMLITISFQTMAAARKNPVSSLRTE